MARTLLLLIVFASATSLGMAQQPVATAAAESDDERQQRLEAEFAKRLSGATLQGFFSTTEELAGDEPPKLRGDRYDFVKVQKGEGNRWLFQSRIRYGNHDVTIPLNLPVEWAGETPVIVVDDLNIPGMGIFTARVMFHEDHYAGYWSGGDHGGHLIGRIVRDVDQDQQKPKPEGEAPNSSEGSQQ